MSYTKMPPKRTDDEIRELARDFLRGDVYHDANVEPQLIPIVFMPIGFGGLDGYTLDQIRRLAIFAVRSKCKAVPGRGINGYPIFVECRVWRRRDVVKAFELAERMRAAAEAAT